jgi:hypothetical protein
MEMLTENDVTIGCVTPSHSGHSLRQIMSKAAKVSAQIVVGLSLARQLFPFEWL